MAKKTSAEYLGTTHLHQRFGISPQRVQQASLRGKVRVLLEPGRTPRYHVGDVERELVQQPVDLRKGRRKAVAS
jgi:hypothetical protein